MPPLAVLAGAGVWNLLGALDEGGLSTKDVSVVLIRPTVLAPPNLRKHRGKEPIISNGDRPTKVPFGQFFKALT